MKRNNVVLRESSMVLRRLGRLRLLGRLLFVSVILGTGRSGTAVASVHVPFGHGGAALQSSTGSAVQDPPAGTRTHIDVSAPRMPVDSAREIYRYRNRSTTTTHLELSPQTKQRCPPSHSWPMARR